MDSESEKNERVNENEKLYRVRIGTDRNGGGEMYAFYHEAKKGRDLIAIKISRINNAGWGVGADAGDGVARDESDHINPAALRSFCNLASSAQACASRTSGSEDVLPSSTLLPPWPILAAVSVETVAETGWFVSSSREREKPCRSKPWLPNAARNLWESGLSLGVEFPVSEEARMLRSHLLTLQ